MGKVKNRADQWLKEVRGALSTVEKEQQAGLRSLQSDLQDEATMPAQPETGNY